MDMDAGRAEAVLRGQRKRLRPSKKELEMLKMAERRIRARLELHVPDGVEIGLMGSVAKGTALRDNRDLDIFLLFPKKYDPQEAKRKGIEWAKKAMRGLKCELNYAQHPYLKVYMPGLKVDIVPSYKIENHEKLKTAVDRSQLHTVWVNGRINDAMRDDVRLLKQFLKSIGVYGAQSRVEGFSGYLCELLIIKYGSFLNLLEEAANWSRPVIDIEGFHGEKGAEGMFEKAAMVVIDPVDKARNVSAVVSHTSLSRFILAARDFLKKPSSKFFAEKKRAVSSGEILSSIKRRGTHMILLRFAPPRLVEDVLWPKMRKTAQALIARLEADEFRVFGHYFYADEKDAFILIELMDWGLPKIKHIVGPQVCMPEHADMFIRRHKMAENLHAEHGRVVAIERRERTKPIDSVLWAIKNAQRVGIPEEFAKALKAAKNEKPSWLASSEKLRAVAADYLLRKI
ncbi:MAG: CCA tRNA nucleotidyltransferase [Candidatus Micrarchaeota archaeon]